MIYVYIISAYLIYFLGQIIYDGFIAKPIDANNNNDLAQNVIMEEDSPALFDNNDEQVQNVTFENIQSDNGSTLDYNNISEMSEEEISLQAKKKSQEEELEDSILDDDTSVSNVSQSHLSEENTTIISDSFILNLEKLFKSENQKVQSIAFVDDIPNVETIINDSTRITSFSYANIKMI